MRKPAVSYLRVSGKGQVLAGGFPRQRQAVTRYAKRNGLEIVQEFRDSGISGTKELADRPGLASLLDRIESNGVKVVLVENADRMARDLLVGEVILSQFRNAGVQVVTASGTDLTAGDETDPTRKLIRQVLGAVAEFDKNVTVLKLRASRDRIRQRNGVCEGRKPFGYYDGEPEIIDRMRQLRRKPRGKRPMSYARIAEQLNAEGLTTRMGRPWQGRVVQRILKRRGNRLQPDA